jgi:AbrB family looped-hinge helix DNA binding protein
MVADKILATLTSKGQITVPAQHRKAWGLKPGDQIAFDPPTGKSVRIEPRRKRSIFERLDELKLPPLGRPLTQKDIDDSIAEAMAEKYGSRKRKSGQ